MTKFFDWKGNEIKAGMTIYFVQTKPGVLESSRVGLMMPHSGETIWEDEKGWQERKNQEIWELGEPYEVTERDGILMITRYFENDPDIDSLTTTLQDPFNPNPILAIKGISDKKQSINN